MLQGRDADPSPLLVPKSNIDLRYSSTLFLTSAQEGGEGSASHPGRKLTPPERPSWPMKGLGMYLVFGGHHLYTSYIKRETGRNHVAPCTYFFRRVQLAKINCTIDFKLSPCTECCMLSFGLFPGV